MKIKSIAISTLITCAFVSVAAFANPTPPAPCSGQLGFGGGFGASGYGFGGYGAPAPAAKHFGDTVTKVGRLGFLGTVC